MTSLSSLGSRLERRGKPRNSPNTLTIDDYEKIKKSGYLMARKFDTNVDKAIIEKLMIFH